MIKTKLAQRFISLLLLIFTMLLSACGGPPETPQISVSLTPASAKLRGGQKIQLTATVTNATDTAVTWDKTGGILDVSGSSATFTMPNIASDSSFTVTATSVADPSKKTSATFNLDTASQARIEITSDRSILFGQTGNKTQVHAVVYKPDGTPDPSAKIEWRSSDPNQVSVNSDGEVTALTSLGSAQIMASYADLDPQVASAFIATTRPATKLIQSDVVKSSDAATSQVVLAKTAATSALKVGDILYNGGQHHLMARVTALSVSTDTITATVEAASLSDTFSAMKVVSSDLPEEFREKMLQGVKKQTSSNRQAASPCKFDALALNAEFKLGTASSFFNLSPFFDYEIDDAGVKWFKLGAAGTIRVQGTLGELKITGGLGVKITCKAKLGVVLIPAFTAGPVLIDGLLTGEAGIEITPDLKAGLTCTLLTLDFGAKAYAGFQWDRNQGTSTLQSSTTLGNGVKGPKCAFEPAQIGIKFEPFLGVETAVGMDFPFPVPGFHVGLLEGKVIAGLEVKHDAFYPKTDESFRGFDWNVYTGLQLTPEPLLKDLDTLNKSIGKYFGFSNPKLIEIKSKLLELKLPLLKAPSFSLSAPSTAKPETEIELKVSSDIPPGSSLLPFYALDKVEIYAIKGNNTPFKIGESKIDSLGNGKVTWKTPKALPDKDNTYKLRALIYDNILSLADSPTYASKPVDVSLDPDFDLKIEPPSVYREAKKGDIVYGFFGITNYGIDFQYTARATGGLATMTGIPNGSLKLLEYKLVTFRATCTAVGQFSDRIEINISDPKNPTKTTQRTVPFTLVCQDKKKPKPKDPPPPPKPPKPNDPPPPPPPPPIRAHSSGDPHLMTYDGHFYDFQATGDFILSKSLIPDDEFEVQVRYRKPLSSGPTYSLGYAVAANVGGTKLEVYATPSGKPKIFVNATEVTFTDTLDRALSGGGAISVHGSRAIIGWSDQSSVSIDLGADYIGSVDLFVNGWRKGQLEGLLGNGDDDPNNDLKIRGGAVLTNPSLKDLYLQYRQSWRVPMTSQEALFTQGPDLFDPFFPPNIITLADLDPAAVANAQAICLARGIVTEDIFLACVFDIALTGDPAWADIAFGVDPNVPGVYVRPSVMYVPIGRVERIRRIGAYITGVENDDVTWTVSGGRFLQVQNNVIDFIAPNTEGVYEITATLSSDPSLKSSTRVIVAPASYVFWDGGGDKHSFADAKNWGGDKVPDADTDVVIQNNEATPLTINDNIGQVYSIRTEGKVSLNAGTINTKTGGQLKDGFSLEGGNIQTQGIVTFSGQTTWSVGSLGGTGKFVNTGELDLIGGNYKYISSTLENAGTIKVSDTFYSGAAGSMLKNDAGATLEFGNDASIQPSTDYLTISNAGTILKSGGIGTSNFDATLNNSGTLEARVGRLLVRGTMNGGTYNASLGATLELYGEVSLQGQLSGAPAGNVISNANLNLNAETHLNFTGTGFNFVTGHIKGASKLVNDAGSTMLFTPGNYKYIDSTLENAGMIKVSDTFYSGAIGSLLRNLASGTLEFVGDVNIQPSTDYLTIENTGKILKSGGIGTTIFDATLNNTGTLEVQKGTLQIHYGSFASSQYVVADGATLEFTNGPIQFTGIQSGSPVGRIQINGANLSVPSGQEAHFNFSGTGLVFKVTHLTGAGTYINDGLLSFLGGNYKYIDGTLENKSLIQVSDTFYSGAAGSMLKNDAGATLEFVNDTNIQPSTGYLSIQNAGKILKSGGTGTSVIDADLTNTGTLESQVGTLRIRGVLNGGIYNSSAGATLDWQGNITTQGTLTGNLAGSLVFSNGSLNVAGETHLSFAGTGFSFATGHIQGAAKLVNDTLMNFIGGNYKYIDSTLENAGTIKVSDTVYSGTTGSLLRNLASGTLEFLNDASVLPSTGYLTISNAGTILKSGGAGTTLLDATLNNTGTLETRTGTIRLLRGTLNGGTYKVLAGATLELQNDLTLQGTLSGNIAGTLNTLNLTLRVPDTQTAHLNFTGNGFNFSVGNIVGPGILINDTLMNFIGGNYKYLSSTLENAGTIKVSDTFYSGATGSLLKNRVGATLEFVNDTGISPSSGSVTLQNAGTLLKSGGTGNSTLTTIFTNTGTITEASGHFVFN